MRPSRIAALLFRRRSCLAAARRRTVREYNRISGVEEEFSGVEEISGVEEVVEEEEANRIKRGTG